MRLKEWIADRVDLAVNQLFTELGQGREQEFKVKVEASNRLDHGDYATNVAMQLARSLRKAPMHLAEKLKGYLQDDTTTSLLIERIEVAAPGFLNLSVNWEEWAHRLSSQSVPETAAAYSGKVVIEHTSINPNKSAHIGHLRNSCIGDTLVLLLRRTGSTVEVHNYIDDLGNQLADTLVGLGHLPMKAEHHRFGDFCWDVYAGINKEYKLNPALTEERANVLHALEEGHNNLSWLGLLTAERIVREHLEEMERFGITYDLLVWESHIVREGFWNTAFEMLKTTPSFHQETTGKLAGCWVLRQPTQAEGNPDPEQHPQFEHSADKVLVRSNGILTYTAKDIAYHLWKFGLLPQDFHYRSFAGDLWTTDSAGEQMSFGQADHVINVIDYRQEYPQEMVRQALGLLGYEEQANRLHHVSYGVVSLSPSTAAELGIDTSDGKASYAMSGRQGIGVKVAELLERMEQVVDMKRSDHNGISSREIAAASIRYYLLRFNLQTEVILDLQQATEITGNTGVYLLYAYARANNVLSRADISIQAASKSPEWNFPEVSPQEHALIRQIAAWPDTLSAAAQELAPNLVCSYAYDLASLFNQFYACCPILKEEGATREFRCWLTAIFRETLGDCLKVLGLPTPSRM